MGAGGSKFITFDNVAAGATAHGWWNNAKAEMYRLSAWPKVAAGISASAEITQIKSIVHGNPSERELHFWVKNTGTTTIDIDVWGFWWDWALKPVLEDIRSEFNAPAVGAAIVTNQGVVALDVAGRRKHGDPTVVEPGDKWHLGSDTKAMTATLLGVLIQKGASGGLSWNSTCADAFPEWAQSMKSLKNCTFEQLMAHRSGSPTCLARSKLRSETPAKPLSSAGATLPNWWSSANMECPAGPTATRTGTSSWPRPCTKSPLGSRGTT